MNEVNSDVYENEQALRHQVELISRRSLTDDEWALVAPDWSAPYGEQDVGETVRAVGDSLPTKPKASTEEKARAHRRAQVQRVALEAKEMVESAREELFGHKEPPFSYKGIEAAAWIEAQVQEPETRRFHIEVTVPAGLGRMESLIWLRDYLTENLDNSLPGNNEDPPRFMQFLESDAVRDIGWGMPVLAYLGVNPEGEMNIKWVQAPDGTLLGRLQNKAERLAKATDWELYAAVHHLLTGGIAALPTIRAKFQYRGGSAFYGDAHPMTLEISDPFIVTQNDLITAFSKKRSDKGPSRDGPARQRSKVAPKSERVAAFVEEHPAKTWAERLVDWNRENPGDHYRTESAMKRAYYRAIQR